MPDMYGPCPCGSGKKFKFCCFQKGKTLNREDPRDLLRRSAEFTVYECQINPDWQEKGMATILVARQMPNLKYVAGVYLVDVFCLGLKDTFCMANVKYSRIEEFKQKAGRTQLELPYEDARSIILGAIEYAEKLGFQPHEDWNLSKDMVEYERPFEKRFEFGKDGKPLYLQGPNDDVAKIMDILNSRIRAGEAHYITQMGPDAMPTLLLEHGRFE